MRIVSVLIQTLAIFSFRVIDINANGKNKIMTEKDYTLYGTKIYNYKTREIRLLIYTRKNKFADGNVN